MSYNEKKPAGENLRDLVNPAFDDERRENLQADILNKAFDTISDSFEAPLTHKIRVFFNYVAQQTEKKPKTKTPMVLEALTRIDPMTGQPAFSPIMILPIPVVAPMAGFTADTVKSLPGYIKLHEKARDLDVSIRIHGLLSDEVRGNISSYLNPPLLIIDATKSYEEGALENGNLYPDLPEKKQEFKREGKGRDQKF